MLFVRRRKKRLLSHTEGGTAIRMKDVYEKTARAGCMSLLYTHLVVREVMRVYRNRIVLSS
jgi:hypothetical protein